MTARAVDLEAALGNVLDRAISAREDQESRRQASHAKHLALVEDFVARAAAAISVATETINARADRRGLDAPTTVEKQTDQRVAGTIAASVTVSMTRPALVRDAHGRPPASRRYAWTVHVWLHLDGSGCATRPEFKIEGHRDGWWDWWKCDIPTAECDPAGLSLKTSGDEVARRFMVWFARYVA